MMMWIATQHYLNDLSLKFSGIRNMQGAWGPIHTCWNMSASHHMFLQSTCFDPMFWQGMHTLLLVLPHAVSACFNMYGQLPNTSTIMGTFKRCHSNNVNFPINQDPMLSIDSRYSWPTMPSEEGLSSFLF